MKISVIGAGGQGKTSLVKRLVSDLKIDGFDAVEVVEYARSFIEECGGVQSAWEQLEIMEGQLERERNSEKYEIVVCDITPWLAFPYATTFVDYTSKRDRYVLKRILGRALDICHQYDHCFYLPKIFNLQADEVRKEWAEKAAKNGVANLDGQAMQIDDKIKAFMILFDIPYTTIDATDISERVRFIRKTAGLVLPEKKRVPRK